MLFQTSTRAPPHQKEDAYCCTEGGDCTTGVAQISSFLGVMVRTFHLSAFFRRLRNTWEVRSNTRTEAVVLLLFWRLHSSLTASQCEVQPWNP